MLTAYSSDESGFPGRVLSGCLAGVSTTASSERAAITGSMNKAFNALKD